MKTPVEPAEKTPTASFVDPGVMCADCSADLPAGVGVVEATSSHGATYYRGPAICHNCSEKRWENHLIDIEAGNT